MKPTPMDRATKTALERRLEPLVRKAFELYGEQGFPGGSSASEPAPSFSDKAAFAAWYQRSVAREIEAGYRLSPANGDRLRALVAAGELGPFAPEDAENAIEILDAVLGWSLSIENETGGGKAAVARVAEQFPGLSRGLLGKVMAIMEYYNR